MAQLACGVIGGVIGTYFGMPQLGFMAGSLVGGLLFPSNPPASATYPKITASTYGVPINVLYGTMRLQGNMIFCDNIYTKKGSTGKGSMMGGSSSTPISRVDFAVAFCEGPVTNITRMWADGILIYDVTNPSLVAETVKTNFFFYNGSEDQMPDPMIAEWVGTNVPASPLACPAYRGLCYALFPGFTITNFGNRIPNITAELTNAAVSDCPNIQLTPITSGPFTQLGSNDIDIVAVDWVTQRMFRVGYDAGQPGIRAYSLVNNAEYQQAINLDVGGTLAVGQGGYLYTSGGSAGNSYAKIDTNTLESIISVATPTTYDILHNTGNQVYFPASQICVQQVTTNNGSKDILFCIESSTPWAGGYVIMTDQLEGLIGPESNLANAPPLPYGYPYGNTAAVAGSVNTSYSDVFVANMDGSGGTNVIVLKMSIAAIIDKTDIISQILETSGFYTFALDVNTVVQLDRSAFTPGTTEVGGSCSIAYDTTDGNLIVTAFSGTVKVNSTTGAIIWRVAGGVGIGPQTNLTSGQVGFRTNVAQEQFTTLNTRTGAVTLQQNLTTGATPDANAAMIYDGASNSIICANQDVSFSRIYLGLTTGVTYPLSDIVSDIVGTRCGLTPSQIDTSLLENTTAGFAITRVTTGKDVLASLAQAYFFDVIESDFTLKFVPKGTTSIATIPQADLGSAVKPEDGNFWKKTRSQAIDLPTYIQVNFIDLDNDYLPNAGFAKRHNAPVATVYSKQRLIVDIPVAMHLTDANTVASTWLWTLWTEVDHYDTSLGWQYLYLDPSDTISVNLDSGDSYNVRISQINTGADYSLKLEAVGEDSQTYTQNTTLTNVPSPYVKVVPQNSYARPFLLNVPLLRTFDDTGGTASRIYYGAGAFTVNWAGGELNDSTDGETFSPFDYISTSVTWGTVIGTLGNTKLPFSTDNVNTLKVAMVVQNTTLSSAAFLDFMNGANAALVGSEIIQFQNVTTNSDGTLTLSTLLRGRQGTEWACCTHVPGETLIFLDTNLHLNTIPLSQIGDVQYDKLVPNGTFLDAAPMTSVTYLGYDLKPYAPVNFSREPSGSDVAISWSRRSRFDSDLEDGTGTVPLAEQSESYDAYILAAPYNPATANYATPASAAIVRSFLGLTSPMLTYTAAEMGTDSFSPSVSTLHIVVFQNSAAIGHGWPGAADLAAF